MVDVVSTTERSRMMAGIRSKDTKPEMVLRRGLHRLGFRYKLHDKSLPGRPDLVFPKFGAVVLVHGCYWHGHAGCKYFKVPATRTAFWRDKIEGNRSRDSRDRTALHELGWRTAIVWECATRHDSAGAVTEVAGWLLGTEETVEIEWP